MTILFQTLNPGKSSLGIPHHTGLPHWIAIPLLIFVIVVVAVLYYRHNKAKRDRGLASSTEQEALRQLVGNRTAPKQKKRKE